jgi:hypothetical protein
MHRWLTTIFQRKTAEAAQADGCRLGNPKTTHPYEVQADHPLADVVSGMCFQATLQLRTPVRILKRNGQTLPLGADLPDDFEQWMGIWVPKTKTWVELSGKGVEAEYETTVASHIGPVKPSEYIPFLSALRQVVEDPSLSLNDQQSSIAALCRRPEFQEFAERHGGADEIFIYYHPLILSVIPGLTASARDALTTLGLNTVSRIRNAQDSKLSGVKGLGPSKIAGIRAFCDSYRGDPDVEYRTEIE